MELKCGLRAVRIRTVAERGFSPDFLSSWHHLFAGFPPLLLRQVFFGMAKFLVFDTVAAMVYRQLPWMANRKGTSSMVSMFSGAVAGIISTFVSQPADAILTCMSATPQLGIAGAASALWRDGLPGSILTRQFGAFYAGFSTRAAWAAAIIGGQFLLYDVAKRIFGVTHGDLSQTADALSTALRNDQVFQPSQPGLAGGPRPRTVSATSRRFVHGRLRPPVLVGRSWLRRIRCRFLSERPQVDRCRCGSDADTGNDDDEDDDGGDDDAEHDHDGDDDDDDGGEGDGDDDGHADADADANPDADGDDDVDDDGGDDDDDDDGHAGDDNDDGDDGGYGDGGGDGDSLREIVATATMFFMQLVLLFATATNLTLRSIRTEVSSSPMLQDTARSLSPLERTSSSVSSQTKASSCSNITEDCATLGTQRAAAKPRAARPLRTRVGDSTAKALVLFRLVARAQALQDRIPPYPFPADFQLPFGQDERVNVISQLCDSPGGPSTIALLLPGVHGGVGPCREPGSNFDENCLYAMVAQRLQELGRAVDVYRCSWQFMCPTMTYSLNAVCHVLQHALKQALGSCLRSGGWGLWC
eukprot:s3892_g4.t2